MSKLEAFQKQMEALHRAYVSQLPGKVDQIEALWQAVRGGTRDKGSLQLLYHLVHKLNGSGPTFGYTAITERAECLEEVVKKLLLHGTPPTEEEHEEVEKALASLHIIAAAATANRPGFSAHDTAARGTPPTQWGSAAEQRQRGGDDALAEAPRGAAQHERPHQARDEGGPAPAVTNTHTHTHTF